MPNREQIKKEFEFYLSRIAKSPRRSADSFNLSLTAVGSYLNFIEANRLFDYNPDKWKSIDSLYDITEPDQVRSIADSLLKEEAFLQRDNQDNQGWRSGAIMHYTCFIEARSYFGNKHDNEDNNQQVARKKNDSLLQQIFYGAPGTGKSFTIENDTKGEDVIRTTFHPDSDYSTFVGTYKPTTREVPMRDVTGKVIIENGQPVPENRIIYEFVNQAFLQAYIGAWEKMADKTTEKPKKQFLVIEEINRGNCAQIFGDLFQLLDRNAQGFSEYPIKADADMKKQLKKHLSGLTIADAESINAMYDGKDIVGQVLEGDILLLPNNLFIWATMNTSDQSLFPIDSAFKRRWDWQYVPIANAGKGWKIQVNGKEYGWWDFLEKINALIGETTHSEDKKLGYFFCKTQDGIINAQTFVSKVIFYLWNDVFKDFEFEDEVFVDTEDAEHNKLTFDKFYYAEASGRPTVRENKVELFFKNLGLEPIGEAKQEFYGDATFTKGHLKVTIPQKNVIIEYNTSAETLAKFVEFVRPELVFDLKLKAYQNKDTLLVSRVQPAEQSKPIADTGYYVVTKFSVSEMAKRMRWIADGLKMECIIEEVEVQND